VTLPYLRLEQIHEPQYAKMTDGPEYWLIYVQYGEVDWYLLCAEEAEAVLLYEALKTARPVITYFVPPKTRQ